ncbi:hypothetical protein DDN44_11800 [Vibrio cholerae]|nr:hypothetical protein [Vibrio cholerae]EGR4287017.1 hypothetical protein [Vibrio cholerae]ELJ8482290.1 hypothetical protein [Vibrio cholerae]
MSLSKLFINRLVVHGSGKIVYDQKFHLGVNIIRGKNGTGKSTIMDLLNYGLGAEITEWTEHQIQCDWVALEVTVNGHIVTLKRDITPTGQEKVLFFDGEMTSALKDHERWTRYGMRRSGDTHSFSQHMFELLNMPRHQTDDSKNLTMHQILRLIYVDQLSAPQKLLKEDTKFDNLTIRRAIGEYLLGIDTLDAYNLRQELIEANREFEKFNAELNSIYRMFGHKENLVNLSSLNNDIEAVKQNIVDLENKRLEIKSTPSAEVSIDASKRIRELVSKIEELSNKLSEYSANRLETQVELNETTLFLRSLEQRKSALGESQVTYNSLGTITFKYCPSCLEPLESAGSDNCGLCKSPKHNSEKDFAYSQLLNELNFQISESKKLIKSFEDDLLTIDSQTPLIKQELNALKSELKEINSSTDEKEAELLKISTEIGFKQSQVISLEEKREQVSNVDNLQRKKVLAQNKINELQEKLDTISARQEQRYVSVYEGIESKAKELLKADGGYEGAFDDPDDIVFDFSKDKMYVNGRNKFSASSMVVLKNSIRFSIFSQSADDSYSRFPNLILMDNIEDKGMVVERSQNFQRQMVEVCNTIKNDFQLIYTTSMIASELEGTTMCVGPFYEKGCHTLEF